MLGSLGSRGENALPRVVVERACATGRVIFLPQAVWHVLALQSTHCPVMTSSVIPVSYYLRLVKMSIRTTRCHQCKFTRFRVRPEANGEVA